MAPRGPKATEAQIRAWRDTGHPYKLLAAEIAERAADKEAVVTYESPNKCKGNHADWRWAAKTEEDRPPETISERHRVTPTDVGEWHAPDGTFDRTTPRRGMAWHGHPSLFTT